MRPANTISDLPGRAHRLYERDSFVTAVFLLVALCSWSGPVVALESGDDANMAQGTQQRQAAAPMYIREYRVEEAHLLKPIEIEEAVYPYLGPGRTADDVEHARAALEQAYKDKGFQTVSVQIPPQQARGGVVVLQVIENRVGRLRVHGSRYFSLEQIKKGAPSLVEGKAVDFNQVTRDIVALNQLPDRRITPSLRAGVEPNTVDVDLTVKDTFPLHGSIELNNRYSADTVELRLNGSVSYNNLWQLGHSAGFSFQIAPEDVEEVKVFSGFYTVRVPSLPWVNLMLQATKQDSNVSTLGGSAVAGKGEVVGERLNFTLPAGTNFFHFFNFGIDYKHFDQNIVIGTSVIKSPISYYPFSAAYGATWAFKGSTTEFNSDLTFHLRGLGSNQKVYDNRRFNSDGSFIYLRSDLAHTHELPWGFQAYGKVQGQISNAPLVDSEQFAGGGLGTARGYLESTALGDNALFGTVELRTPPLLPWFGDKTEWRLYTFCDAGCLTLRNPLPEQQSRFNLASVGVGSRIRLMDHLNGSLDAGWPLVQQSVTSPNDLLLTVRVWAEF